MKKIRIVFNANGGDKIGSVRIPMEGIKSKFELFEEFEVVRNDFDNYKNFDVAILHADDEEVLVARSQNPNILIGLVKPHHERVVHAPLQRFNLKSFLYQTRFFIGDKNSKFIKKRNNQIKCSDFVIADSMHLQNLYESDGCEAIYLKLIEDFKGKTTPLKLKKSKMLIFGYHGNYRHFLESKNYIFPALCELSKTYNVTLKVVSNLSDFKPENSDKFKIEYIDYTFPGVFESLNDVDIGLVPNQIDYKYKFYEILFSRMGCLFWKTDKYHDLVFRFKESSNAGRAFVFSQLGIPFIACPVPEVVSVFGDVLEEFLPFNKVTWKHCILKLAANEDKRIELSNKLIEKNKTSIDLLIEANKLRRFILNKIESNY
ncbi:hypothetical protein H4J46_00025 [Colwellia sp. MB02u-6]|uniref:hypothetical protein n=1 Tax=Colwellia sp. MB02u-6 TaxID=2759824 RepID=UPI0015F63E9C|nr:hypothetical protein [Colwellia sp. MB02u-6]MBA6326358.1 hypothetical protein [Colwellia sp. MB02u-6]